jgi:hypothetical protein
MISFFGRVEPSQIENIDATDKLVLGQGHTRECRVRFILCILKQ